MTGIEDKWKDRQKQFAARAPRFRIDRCELKRGKGGYTLVVEGIGLRPAVSPVSVTVGGKPVTDMRFQPDGRQMTAALEKAPKDRNVVIDLGHVVGKCSAADE